MNNDSSFNRFSILDTDETEVTNNIKTTDDELKEKHKISKKSEKKSTTQSSCIEDNEIDKYDTNKFNHVFKNGFKNQYSHKKYEHQESASIDDIKIDKNNIKKMLCFNMLNKGVCNYGNKCMYAHNLEEQKKDPLREQAYKIIFGKDDLSSTDLLTDKELYHSLIQLTRTCMYCNKGVCTGGYNCKYGAIKSMYQICYDDLMDGSCQRLHCPYIHLTNRGLVPYSKQKIAKRMENENGKQLYSSVVQGGVTINNSQHESLFRRGEINKSNYSDLPLGTLLTDTFFSNKKKVTDYDSDLDQSDDSVEKIKNYLNQDSDDSCDESIFSTDTEITEIIMSSTTDNKKKKKN